MYAGLLCFQLGGGLVVLLRIMHEIQLVLIDVIEEARRLLRRKIDAFTQLFILPFVQNALLFLFYYLDAIKILFAPQLVLLEIELLEKQVGF